MSKLTFQHATLTTLCLFLSACGGGGSSSSEPTPTPPTNSAPTVQLESASTDEGQEVTLTANAQDADGDGLTYTWQQTQGEQLSYEADGATLTLTAPAVDGDTDYEFEVSVSDGELTAAASATLTVLDTPKPTLHVENLTMDEQDSPHTIELSVELNTTYFQPVTFDYATESGTAEADSDFTASAGTATILPGETATTVAIEIIGDLQYSNDNSDETFTLELTNIINAATSEASATITIKNDDQRFISTEFIETPGFQDEVDFRFAPYVFDAGLPNKAWLVQTQPYAVNVDRLPPELLESDDSFNPFSIYTLNEQNEIIDITTELYQGDSTKDLHAIREATVADFNGDGLEDIAFGLNLEDGRPRDYYWEAQNKILLSQSDGTYRLQDIIPDLLDYTHSIAAGDINGDGHTDLVVGSGGIVYSGNHMQGTYIAINDGNANFELMQVFPETDGDRWGSVHIADLDNDDVPEIITGGWVDPYVRILKKQANGDYQEVFKQPAINDWTVETDPYDPKMREYFYTSHLGLLDIDGVTDIKTADIDNDGLLDITLGIMLTTPEGFNPARTIRVWRNTGDLTFVNEDQPQELTRHQDVVIMQFIDADNDGHLDLNFCSVMPGTWSLQSEAIYLGTPGTEFALANPFGFSEEDDDGTCTWLVDLNHDGILDVLQTDLHQNRRNERKQMNVLVGY